ncbi:hypothetical protein T492DRAFT_1115586 [Pavlovales sp. CCMP2436]|nr:hypothetical protein T492DRAFT_1115586 [Pavlovales sp. CCMP2436]
MERRRDIALFPIPLSTFSQKLFRVVREYDFCKGGGGNCALTLARLPVAHGQVVGSARQLGTNGPEFGADEEDGEGAQRLQHGWRLVNGHNVKCIVNSQSVQTARWQHKLFSQTLFKLSDEASLTLLPGMLEIEIVTSHMMGDNVIRQGIMINKICDLCDARTFHQAQGLLATPDEFFFGHHEELDFEPE